MGQLIAADVLPSPSSRKDEWADRIPFAIQCVWPVVLFPILLFAPEGPWNLVRHGNLDDAEKSLRRLVRKSANIDPKKTLAYIIHTNDLECEIQAGTSYLGRFKGIELRRTEITCMAFAGQVFAGSLFAYNSTYFFSSDFLTLKRKPTYHYHPSILDVDLDLHLPTVSGPAWVGIACRSRIHKIAPKENLSCTGFILHQLRRQDS